MTILHYRHEKKLNCSIQQIYFSTEFNNRFATEDLWEEVAGGPGGQEGEAEDTIRK